MKKIIFILFFCSFPSFLLSTQPLVFSTSTGSSSSIYSIPILKEAYQRLGIEFIVKEYPSKRSLLSVNSGEIDGELHRVSSLQDKFPNLREIKVPIVKLEWVIYSKKYNFVVEGIESIKPYSISTRRGIVRGEKIVAKAKGHLLVNSWPQVLLTLEKDRVDLALISKLTALKILKDNPIDVYELKPPLDEIYLYHYLHKKNEKLIPKITKVLKEMELSGEIQAIWDQVKKNLIK